MTDREVCGGVSCSGLRSCDFESVARDSNFTSLASLGLQRTLQWFWLMWAFNLCRHCCAFSGDCVESVTIWAF